MADVMTATTRTEPRRASTGPVRKAREPGAALLTCALAAVLSLLPVLRDPWVFFSDDAATQILPMWLHLGEQVRDGVWPPLLDLDSWMGGNLSVEALFGVWNPANAVVWVAVSLVPNLAVSAVLVRMAAFVAIALGCYLLCREYGAAKWAASALSVAMPFCGSLFYFDAVKWPAALLAFVWIPYLWWAVRRMARGRTNAVWVFGLGALAVTAGNPYAMLGVVMVLLGVLVETALLRRWRAARHVFFVSTTIAAVVPLVYLPLLHSTDVTWRSSSEVGNSGTLAPGLSDLVNLSVPSFVPEIPGMGSAAVYFCWFALPLAVWLDWRSLGRRWRELGGCWVMAAFLLLAVGPAELWMFRWPLRVLHYGYLAAAVVLALLLSSGLRTDRLRQRAGATAALLGLSFYLSWSAAPDPELLKRHVVALFVLGALTFAAVWAYRNRKKRGFAAVLHLGTVLTFAMQAFWFFGSDSPVSYYFPSSVPQARAEFEHRYPGQVVQIADPALIDPPAPGRAAWRDLVPGNLFQVGGVHSVNAYTGMGYTALSDQMCLGYNGMTCPEGYADLWRRPPGSSVPLADLLRVDTVVVQRKMIPNPPIPRGWAVRDRNERVVVLGRDHVPERPGGRLSWSSPDLRVRSNSTVDDRNERVRFDRLPEQGPARLVFARLAWPGYTATVNGNRVPARSGPAGLLEVELPRGTKSGQLRIEWTPPGMNGGLALATAGLFCAVALGAVQGRRNRRNKSEHPVLTEETPMRESEVSR